MTNKKPTKVKPAFYAYIFYPMKCVAKEHGYNLVLHGSLNRDLDLVAIPWEDKVSSADSLAEHLAKVVGGKLQIYNYEKNEDGTIKYNDKGNMIPIRYTNKPHNRRAYVIDLNREIISAKPYRDKEWYIDLSIIKI